MQLHASCVALNKAGVLILGRSGSGKSGLALTLMAMGCQLVSDDRTEVCLREDWPVAKAPPSIKGRIEARGIGILQADCLEQTWVHLVVDMEQIETERQPPERYYTLLDRRLPLLHKVESTHFAAAIRQYLMAGKAMC